VSPANNQEVPWRIGPALCFVTPEKHSAILLPVEPMNRTEVFILPRRRYQKEAIMRAFPAIFLSLTLISSTAATSIAVAEKGKRCTKTSVSCYDSVSKKARTCITETCTFADGRTTTSTTVELVSGEGSSGGQKAIIQKAPTANIKKAN
jgi:hypothetical protein